MSSLAPGPDDSLPCDYFQLKFLGELAPAAPRVLSPTGAFIFCSGKQQEKYLD